MAKGIKDCEGYECSRGGRRKFATTYPQLAVILDSIFIIFFNIVREIVNGNVVVVDVLHDLQEAVSLCLSTVT